MKGCILHLCIILYPQEHWIWIFQNHCTEISENKEMEPQSSLEQFYTLPISLERFTDLSFGEFGKILGIEIVAVVSCCASEFENRRDLEALAFCRA